MWLFKRRKGVAATAVIHDDCYSKLPDTLKSRFSPAPENAEITHTVQSEDDQEDNTLNPFYLAAVGEGVELMLGSESQPTENYSIDDSPSVDTGSPDMGGEFGGGDGGGAGASDSF